MVDIRFTMKHTSQSALPTLSPVFYAPELELLFPLTLSKSITVVTVTHKTSHSEEGAAAAATAESDQEQQQLQKVAAVEFRTFLWVSRVWMCLTSLASGSCFLTAVCERCQGDVFFPVDSGLLGGLHRPHDRRSSE